MKRETIERTMGLDPASVEVVIPPHVVSLHRHQHDGELWLVEKSESSGGAIPCPPSCAGVRIGDQRVTGGAAPPDAASGTARSMALGVDSELKVQAGVWIGALDLHEVEIEFRNAQGEVVGRTWLAPFVVAPLVAPSGPRARIAFWARRHGLMRTARGVVDY